MINIFIYIYTYTYYVHLQQQWCKLEALRRACDYCARAGASGLSHPALLVPLAP